MFCAPTTSEGWVKTPGRGAIVGGGEELGLCTKQTCLSPDCKVSFGSSWLGVDFEPGPLLGVGNTVDQPPWSLHLSEEAKKKNPYSPTEKVTQ